MRAKCGLADVSPRRRSNKKNLSDMLNLETVVVLCLLFATIHSVVSLSESSQKQLFMGSANIDLLNRLGARLYTETGTARVDALERLFDLSANSQNCVYMGSKDFGLLPLLVSVVSSVSGDAHEITLGILYNLAIEERNSIYMGSKELGLLPVLVSLLSSNNRKGREHILGIVFNLSAEDKNLMYMVSKPLGLIPELAALVSTDDKKVRDVALLIICNLSFEENNRDFMGSESLGILSVLVSVASLDNGDARKYALCTLWNLSSVKENRVFLGSMEVGLFPALVDVLSSVDGEARTNSLALLCSLSFETTNRERMGSQALGLLPLLVTLVSSVEGDERENVIHTLGNLSLEDKNREFMGSQNLGLLPVLVSVVVSSDRIKNSDTEDIRNDALAILWNLSSAPVNRVLMSSENLGLLSALLSIISSDSGEVREAALSLAYNLCLYVHNIPFLVAYKGIPVILATLQSARDDSELLQVSLTVLMLAARHESAARALLALDGLDIISSLLDNCGDANKDNQAMLIILRSFLLRTDETAVAQLSLLDSSVPKLGDILDSMLKTTLDGLDGDYYDFGTFDLVVTVAAIATMAVSDVNKAVLIHKPTILRGLVQVLVLFLDDAPPIRYRGTDDERDTGFVGGGGQDTESAEYAIEALHQLSFFYEDDSDLRKQYMAIDGNILPLLQRLATHPNLSEYARRGARYLCNRINIITAARSPPNNSIDTTTVLSTDTTTDKRIVISYAKPGNKKELVESLRNSLSFLDFDVWRDELEPLDSNETMVQAIESSHTVVVCVSPEYYTSAICRQEAQYIHTTLKKKGKLLRVIYVMTDRSYSHSVDGWLKAMMGDSPRYPLWDSQHVSKTAMSIARRTLLSAETSPSIVMTAPPLLSSVEDGSILSNAGIFPNWDDYCKYRDGLTSSDKMSRESTASDNKVKELCSRGIPSNIRGKVWPLLIGNELT
eukprot:gene34866-45119_t